MVNPIEQIIAPGKYAYELAMELLEIELKNPSPVYNKSKLSSEKNFKSKDDSYYASSKNQNS